jgi:hypothetical protein
VWREEFKPLPIDIWLAELERLVARCAQGASEDEDRAVRRAYNLARLSPLAVRKVLAPFAAESELESTLEDGQIEEAAKIAIGVKAEVEVRDSPSSARTLAIFTLPGDEPVHFEAASPALAMIGAWASFLTTIQQN